jgi:hypothetical protein
MSREVYTIMGLLRTVDIDAIAEWLESVASGKTRDSVLPIDDFEA